MTKKLIPILPLIFATLVTACAQGGDAYGDGNAGNATNTVNPTVGDINL
ncbi:MAG: hypothetical protein OIF51_08860 [Cellvibrionaceae bacterium]|nr:hypothetical protein [Cellvibrionaceae bacterium]